MSSIKLGSWIPTLLISLVFIGAVYFYKDHEMKQAIIQYEKQQAFIQEQVAKFGVVDAQFEELLAGRSITLEGIKQSQVRVDSLLNKIDQIEKSGSSESDSIQLQQALDILGL